MLKKIISYAWYLEFWAAVFGATASIQDQSLATKNLVIAKTQRLKLKEARIYYWENQEKMEKVFGEEDLTGWVREKEWKRIHNELRTIYNESK